jgi:hypothetical protein
MTFGSLAANVAGAPISTCVGPVMPRDGSTVTAMPAWRMSFVTVMVTTPVVAGV